ncbi:B12-binding domain-containing radical SAM protein [Desulfobulbus alkaliphilus]|uniref:B12-binding domain-containing radical SAM protein n=1 Tax=Desulfobulbus alkaliphilus TaxID=869814 RepID=UPI0019667306|nr:radical SAM protein [Desulfobulbus alkaliphilus]MBM9536627.1 radical SAM protein [Desulfobulbus alkaliphilus]
MLLIAPPVAKPDAPPAGIALLAGSLRHHGVPCTLLDANLEGLLFLLDQAENPGDTWSSRALRHRHAHLVALRSLTLYRNRDRYQRAVRDINRVLASAVHSRPELSISLANYQDSSADPLNSRDLLREAEQFERSIYTPWFRARLPDLLASENHRLIGISLSFLSQALPTFALLGYLRSTFPHLILVLGGGLITSWMNSRDWNDPFAGLVDHCIAGPGENPLLRLFGIDNACEDPVPDYADLPLTDYLAPGPILPYAASQGCYWNRCSFCPEAAEQNRYRPIRPSTALTHLRQLCEQMQPMLIHLLDNALSPTLLQTLGEHPPGAPWYGFARVNEQLADPDYCRTLRLSGCALLKLGLESGSQHVLDAMNKGIQLDLVIRVLDTLHQAGIATYVYLLFGTPSESIDEARQTLAFTLRNHQAITFLNLAIFNMPRGSKEAVQVGGTAFSAGDLSLYRDFIHPRGWDRRAIRTFLDREFTRHPAISSILHRDPPLFTSNHAAFFSDCFPWPAG